MESAQSLSEISLRVARDAYVRRGPLASAKAIISVGLVGLRAPDVVVTTSMNDAVLARVVSLSGIGCRYAFIDTGYHFDETLQYLSEVEAALTISVDKVRAPAGLTMREKQAGGRPYDSDPDNCCARRKVAPLEEYLAGRDVWLTGVRRADSIGRSQALPVLQDPRRKIRKVNPLLLWSDDDVRRFEDSWNLPEQPLRRFGYTSVGCWPCTDLPDGSDDRSGRWANRSKTECGLHREFVPDEVTNIP